MLIGPNIHAPRSYCLEWISIKFGVHNGEITLISAQQGAFKCNNGAAKAQRNDYTSQLIITDNSLSGSNIKCIHDNGTISKVIGNSSIPTIMAHSGTIDIAVRYDTHTCRIYLIADPLSPSIDMQLINVCTNQLVFKWNESIQCSSLLL